MVTIAIGPTRDKWYYRYFETGARPHEIRAKESKALLFNGDYAESASQTGGASTRPVLRPAVDTKQKQILDAISGVLLDALKG